jgi:hypothetical protein
MGRSGDHSHSFGLTTDYTYDCDLRFNRTGTRQTLPYPFVRLGGIDSVKRTFYLASAWRRHKGQQRHMARALDGNS